ncbi:MAG TPA: 16S rRNA (adenine(1518)-N(6)/adenine(1519)-N(6))-dimethyltransferase RsmA [Planctomycetaceae bacterium]|nr:16S rRNA (adenine(1518)-N(6)/adenine(1519)-N(6))-dimethyltransferase RsmA [Planctomycetaceae bacterium]HQZ63536.1 16S rRNA (adenine(1518)-N(6)/adenine(1519)-N(6))-dimethyltransferase RsmA [Planctomycetaceae bacterium]
MKDVQRQTRSWLMELFTRHGFNPRGDLGQNFLIDVNLIEFVVRHAELGHNDVALEVGSGTGGMTAFLAEVAGKVISVDIDKNMAVLAAEAVKDCDNVTLVNKDILKNKNTLDAEICDLIRQQVASLPNGRLKLVANLPYSVATPVISNMVASDLPWERMVCTIQWELAEKMAAEHGTSGYSALSVWIQSQASIRILRKLGPNVFWPRPKVDSAIISIWRDKDAASRITDRRFFLDFLRRSFSQRRKFVRSVLVGMYRKQLEKEDVDRVLTELGHAKNDRVEQMDIATLIRLSNGFQAAVSQKTL